MDKVAAAKLTGHYVVDELCKILYNICATEFYIIMQFEDIKPGEKWGKISQCATTVVQNIDGIL